MWDLSTVYCPYWVLWHNSTAPSSSLWYALLLIVIFILQMSVGIVCLGLRFKLNDDVLKKAWEKADYSLKARTQHEFECCGFNAGSQNILHGSLGHPLCNTPALNDSCCSAAINITCCTGYTHNDTSYGDSDGDDSDQCLCPSCVERINPIVEEAIVVVGVVCVMFSFTELIAAWLTCNYRNLRDPNLKPGLFV
jgi:tetraspanin-13/31